MTAWFGSKKGKEASNDQNMSSSEAQNNAASNEVEPIITITENARSKLIELIQGADSSVAGIRVLAEATSPTNPQYSLAFVQEGEDFEDDSLPKKTGTITVIEIIPTYTVNLLVFDGTYFEDMQTNFIWRKDIKLSMLIMA